MSSFSSVTMLAFRLVPGADVLTGLRAVMAEYQLQAAFIAGCVGSLSRVNLRYAGVSHGTELVGDYEIISLGGTLDAAGEHLHLSVADAAGIMRGGHVLPGCTVRTTLEVVLGELKQVRFSRVACPLSGYDELYIEDRETSLHVEHRESKGE